MGKIKSPLVYENPRIEEYKMLAEARTTNILSTLFCNNVYDEFVRYGLPQKAEDFFRSRIKENLLVDPGCGLVYEKVVDVAKKFKASGYVGVDLRGEEKIPKKGDFPAWKFKGDMLEIIAQLETGSSNFNINGIDTEILGMWRNIGDLNKRYVECLGDEITRITRPNGLVFGIDFYPIERELIYSHGFQKRDSLKLGLTNSYSVLEKT